MSEQTLTTGQVITFGDGRMACDMGQVYEGLNGLLDDNLMTHQLPRAGRFVEPYVAEACPWVKDLPPMPSTEGKTQEQCVVLVGGWVKEISAKHGELHTIPDLSGQWVHLNALDEAVAIFGKDRVVPVVVEGDSSA